MLRVHAAGELVADELWALGAVAVTEAGEHLDAAFAADAVERAAASALATRHRVELVRDDGSWADAWRAGARPVTVGGVVVRPAWIDGAGIAIEPGRAFGIGSHATTRLAGDALAAVVRRGDRVLDVGTGTGVLAIVAVALGAATVRAIDVDGHAVDIARANVAANGVDGAVDVDATPLDEVGERFDVVVANLGGLLTPVALAGELAARSTRVLVVSGLLDPSLDGPPLDPLDDVLARDGFERGHTWTADGWAACSWRRSER